MQNSPKNGLDLMQKINQDLYKQDNYRRMPEVYDTIISFVPAQGKELKILDLGCGDGSLLERISIHRKFGVDISEEQLAIARAKGIESFLVNIDLDPLPFEDNFFDIIICTEVIEHVLVPDKLLAEASRVLKKGGKLILTTPNLASLAKRLLLLANRNPFIECSPLEENAVGHLRYFIFSSLLKIVKKYNFKLLRFTSDVINFNGSGTLKSIWLAKTFPAFGRTLIFLLIK